jgi:hypothetical protein
MSEEKEVDWQVFAFDVVEAILVCFRDGGIVPPLATLAVFRTGFHTMSIALGLSINEMLSDLKNYHELYGKEKRSNSVDKKIKEVKKSMDKKMDKLVKIDIRRDKKIEKCDKSMKMKKKAK